MVEPVGLVIGYHGAHDLCGRGKASYLIRCSCGRLFDFFCWSYRKRCPGCKALYVYEKAGGITKNGVEVEWN